MYSYDYNHLGFGSGVTNLGIREGVDGICVEFAIVIMFMIYKYSHHHLWIIWCLISALDLEF